MFISEIVHTEDPFSIKLCYKLNFATEPKKLIKDLGIIQESNKTFMDALKQGSLNNSITKLTENFDIIKGYREVANIETWVRKNLKENKEMYYLNFLIENLDKKYDLILMDSIPTTSFYTNNCLMASDFAIVPVKTDEDCYEQVLPYMTYLSTIREYNKNLDVIGIIPYLAQNNIDMNYLSKFKKVYGNLVYDNIINWDKRVLAWSTSSITTNISNNKIQMRWYDKVLQKTIVRAKDLLSDGNNE
ncbi:ParA family protein [Staphylococcus coagulans]|uniref:ParA family protein n=1 Tax=Staphylococcus coagulans TaxID=74706 RepID=UPI003364EDD4